MRNLQRVRRQFGFKLIRHSFFHRRLYVAGHQHAGAVIQEAQYYRTVVHNAVVAAFHLGLACVEYPYVYARVPVKIFAYFGKMGRAVRLRRSQFAQRVVAFRAYVFRVAVVEIAYGGNLKNFFQSGVMVAVRMRQDYVIYMRYVFGIQEFHYAFRGWPAVYQRVLAVRKLYICGVSLSHFYEVKIKLRVCKRRRKEEYE